MSRTPVNWPVALANYPGDTIREKLTNARSGKTFRQLAEEIGQDVTAVKALYYRFGSATPYAGTRHRHTPVTSKPRPNYAAILNEVIAVLAQERGLTEEACRAWIETEKGQAECPMMREFPPTTVGEFRERCFLLKIPLFTCHYLEKSRCKDG